MASKIYGAVKTTSDLQDEAYADQLGEFRQSSAEHRSGPAYVQQEQLRQAQLRQRASARLPGEVLRDSQPQQQRATGSSFQSFRRQPVASTQQSQNPPQRMAPTTASAPRFQLFYSRSYAASASSAVAILDRLQQYHTDNFIRQHVSAIDFDDQRYYRSLVHQAIMKSERSMEMIQKGCVLYDTEKNVLFIPERHNILKVLVTYCNAMMPEQGQSAPPPPIDQTAESGDRQDVPPWIQQRVQPDFERAAQQQWHEPQHLPGKPPSGLMGASVMAKHVGADISAVKADVALPHYVPAKKNEVLRAETQEEVDQIPLPNVDKIYGKKTSIIQSQYLGRDGKLDQARVEAEFVAQHNAKNRADREISIPQSHQGGGRNSTGGRRSGRANISANFRRATPQQQHLQGLTGQFAT